MWSLPALPSIPRRNSAGAQWVVGGTNGPPTLEGWLDRLNDRTGLAGALRLGGNAAWRWDEGTADSGRLAAG